VGNCKDVFFWIGKSSKILKKKIKKLKN